MGEKGERKGERKREGKEGRKGRRRRGKGEREGGEGGFLVPYPGIPNFNEGNVGISPDFVWTPGKRPFCPDEPPATTRNRSSGNFVVRLTILVLTFLNAGHILWDRWADCSSPTEEWNTYTLMGVQQQPQVYLQDVHGYHAGC
jgi:hypothetical protein